MADTTPSTNMSMPIPIVGQDPGPQWGTDVNSCLTIVDAHDHSTGYGVPITPSGMNISSALTFANNPLTNAKYLGLYLQVSDPGVNGSIYYKGTDLYFQDGAANVIRITQAGSVAGATGTITGLPSGTASASYGSSTYVFQSATNTAATVDCRDIILRNSSASSSGLTLSPPLAMGADIAMTLPTIPVSTSAMNMDSAGGMGTITYDALGAAMTSTGANAIAETRTRATGTSVAAGGVAISASSSTFSGSSGSFADVTNLSVTITTSGRPVHLMLMTDDSANIAEIGAANGAGVISSSIFKFVRDATTLNQIYIQMDGGATDVGTSIELPPSTLQHIDAVAAGTYTYKIQYRTPNSSNVFVYYSKLVAYEL